MARFSARLTLLTFLLILAILLAVRGLAYDHAYFATVRTALNFTDPCNPAPCFNTITPGKTTLNDAVAILRADTRIAEVIVSSYIADADEVIRVAWRWHNNLVFAEGSLLELRRRSPAIEWISLPTHLTFGEVWLAIGKPRAAHVDHVLFTARYADFYAISPSACDGFWNAPVSLMRTRTGLRQVEAAIAAAPVRFTCAEFKARG